MNIRRATGDDVSALRELYAAFDAELPDVEYAETDLEQELREVEEIIRDDVAFVAEHDGRLVGFALAKQRDPRDVRLSDLYVVPEARRRGVAGRLVAAVAAAHRDRAQYLSLEVTTQNAAARAVYARWGFRERWLTLRAPLAALEDRLGARIDRG